MRSTRNNGFCIVARLSVIAVCGLALQTAPTARASTAFDFGPIAEPITSATFSVDLAAMNAHRSVAGFEMNFVQLIDILGGLSVFDLSDELFGLATPPDAPEIDMGQVETGWASADIDASFFPALAGGSIGLRALFTDTVDGMFAMDCILLTVETGTSTIESYYGWPVGDENNGFGIGLADGADLPGPLPGSIPVGATGTGFDETITSKAIYAVPEPATFWLLGAGCVALERRRQKAVRSTGLGTSGP